MKADPYHPDWQRYVGNEPRAVGADVVSGDAKCTTRFIDGIEVVDQKTGQIFKGTVDLGPTLDRIKSGGHGTYLTFFGCPFFLTSALAAERVCISIG